MPSQETIFGEMVFAVRQGADGIPLDASADAYLEGHGYAWIVTSQPGRGTPQDSWSTIGSDILDCCRAIGVSAASAAGSPGPITETEIEAACLAVEGEAGCPWCPVLQT
ncbi:MAG TPA: hypothetical protein VGS22_13250 [Thermoanaerobaculia bacterium]|jgi:hypothetical protein|nr:hypothetical protein [Thermoanaerobaculia bacterium]